MDSLFILIAILSAVLSGIMLLYFKIAERYNIIDKPNERSSHITPTIRGGGIIFPITIILFYVLSSFAYPWFFLAVMLSATISFVDDIRDMPRLLRFGVHSLAAGLILYQAGVASLPVVLIILAFVFVTGVLNAYNFMDGINGITGFYSLAIIIPLMLTEGNPVNTRLQLLMLIALIVFLFFNARKKARCFAGDVGSVSIAVIVCFMLVQRIINTDDYTYLGFLALYLVDTGLTIIQRLKAGDKIFEAHRKHLFQVLSNEMGMPHLVVSLLFAAIQLAINLFLVNTGVGIVGLIVLFLVLIVAYVLIKATLLKRIRLSKE